MIAIVGNLAGVGDGMHRALSTTSLQSVRLDLHHLGANSESLLEGDGVESIRIEIGSKRDFLRAAAYINRNFSALLSVGLGGLQTLPFLRIPYAYMALGSDLRELAVGDGPYPKRRVALARYAIRKASLVIHSPDWGHVRALDQLDCWPRLGFRQPIAPEFWAPLGQMPDYTGTLRILLPASHRWVARFSGDFTKGNDKSLKALALAAERVDMRVTALRRGRDLDASRGLSQSLTRSGVLSWEQPPSNRSDFIRLIESHHLVIDQIGSGAFGLIALEGLARGRPVITSGDMGLLRHVYLDREAMLPMVLASSETDVLEAVEALNKDFAFAQLGNASREWMDINHSFQALGAYYEPHLARHLRLKA